METNRQIHKPNPENKKIILKRQRHKPNPENNKIIKVCSGSEEVHLKLLTYRTGSSVNFLYFMFFYFFKTI